MGDTTSMAIISPRVIFTEADSTAAAGTVAAGTDRRKEEMTNRIAKKNLLNPPITAKSTAEPYYEEVGITGQVAILTEKNIRLANYWKRFCSLRQIVRSWRSTESCQEVYHRRGLPRTGARSTREESVGF